MCEATASTRASGAGRREEERKWSGAAKLTLSRGVAAAGVLHVRRGSGGGGRERKGTARARVAGGGELLK
jgi:hypothetical protein